MVLEFLFVVLFAIGRPPNRGEMSNLEFLICSVFPRTNHFGSLRIKFTELPAELVSRSVSIGKFWEIMNMSIIHRPRKTSGTALFAIASMLLSGCNSITPSTKPTVQITQAPPGDPGGPVQMGLIEGRATGVKSGELVVLYAHSGLWWIQPFASQSFTKLQADSTWSNVTHLGTDYAALLVEPSYHPPSKMANLPAPGNGVIAVASVAGKPGKPVISKIIHFSGYEWRAQNGVTERGGQPNEYDPANAWTDDKGFLHLRIQEHDGVWSCAQVNLARSLGYGSYIFVVRDTSHLGPAAALSLYTRDDFRTEDTPSQLDIELSRWGNADSKNAQYVVQPFYIADNVARFMAPAGVLTHTMHWEPGRVSFKTVRGSTLDPGATRVSEHVFTIGTPSPAKETAHIEFYNYRRRKDTEMHAEEVVIERFEFLP
jgi:hypothetical protein